ncbi:MAG: 30S ribosomal protein S3 [Candidatus Paceibacterota bacterium]
MTHKTHPKSFRLGITENWNSRYLEKENLPKLLEEDHKIRELIARRKKALRIEKVEIERKGKELKIIIRTGRTGLLIGRQGQGIKKIEEEIKKIIDPKYNLTISVEEVKNPDTSAQIVAQAIAEDIEKRKPYRVVMNQYLKKIMQNKGILGAKIMLSGRLDGNEIARDEWIKEGKLPLSTLRADIDYGFSEAYCTYGVVGVKVWIYKGEKNMKEINF